MPARAPWERQPGETDAAWEGFVVYRDLGDNRSLLEAYKLRYGHQTATTPGGHFAKWSRENAWVERARAYDHHREELERAAREQVWQERAAEQANDTWNRATKLEDKLRQMLELPLTEQQVKDGGRTIIIKPTRWSFRDAVTVAKTVDEMKRLATGHPTSRSEVNMTGDGVGITGILTHLDLSQLDATELDTLRTLLERARRTPDTDGNPT